MKMKQGIKRNLALLMCGMLLMQAVFTGVTGGAIGRGGTDGYQEYKIKGTPNAAFSDDMSVSIGTQVGEDNTFNFSIEGKLVNYYLQETYELFLDNGGYDEYDWEEDHQGYSSYDEYLNDQKDLPEMHFTLRFHFKEGALDIGALMAGSIALTDTGEIIGRYELTAPGGTEAVFKANFDKKLFYRQDVTFGKSVAASLKDIYKPGAPIQNATTVGGNDFNITIPEEGLAGQDNDDYEIHKTGKSNDKDLTVTYVITATSKAKPPASGSEATPGEQKKKKEPAKAASDSEMEEDKTLDPEDDEDWEDDGDGSFKGPGVGLSEIIDRLVPERSSRGKSATGDESDDGRAGLDGKKITDQIPDNLKILKVESRINSNEDSDYVLLEQDSESGPLGYHYDETSRVLTYVIPADEDVNVEMVQRADLRITAQLTEEQYNTYLTSGKSQTWTFSNKALLKTGSGDLLAVSNRVDPSLSLDAPYTKDMEKLDSSNREFKWTVKVNSFFTNSNTLLYAVDYIENIGKSHDYVCTGDKSGIKITGTDSETGDKKSEDKTIIELGSLDSTYAYDKVDKVGVIEEIIEAKKAIIEKAVTAGATPDSPLVYKYKSKDKAGNTIENAVMLIPLSDFKNAPVSIEYITRSTIKLEDVSQKVLPVDLKNAVKVLWRWPAGEGPGLGGDYGGATADKTYPIIYSFLNKTSEKYNEDDNTITWNFEVNQFGKQVDRMRITDVFDDTKNKLIEPFAVDEATLILTPAVTGAAQRVVPYSVTDKGEASTENFYTITKADDKTTLIVHLAELNKDGGDKDHFRYQVKTEVTDENLLGNGTKVTIENSVNATAWIGEEKIEVKASAKCDAVNTLIRKSAVEFTTDKGVKTGYYDYDKNAVKWNVTINPRGWNITSPKITDILPVGTHFAELTKVTCKDNGTEEELTITPPADSTDSRNDAAPPTETWLATGDGIKIEVKQADAIATPAEAVEFIFAPEGEGQTEPISIKNKTFSFEFTTNVTEEHRRTTFKSNAPATLINKAVLTGNLNESEKEFSATDVATNTFEPRPMLKTGKYYQHKEFDTGGGTKRDVYGMDWEIYVNRTRANMAGATVTDNIQDFMELIPSSMTVSAVTLEADGMEDLNGRSEVIYKYDSTKPADNTWLTYNKFSYQIPDQYATSTLKFKFTTVMVDDAFKSEMTNKVSISSGDIRDETGDATAEGSKDFRVADYATAKGMYFTKIYKTTAFEAGKFPLQGAEFKITKLSPPDAAVDRRDITKWTEDSTAPTKTRVSNRRGGVSFMFLDEGAMYKIVETKAPTGYITPGSDDEPAYSWYVVPKTVAGQSYPLAVEDAADSNGGKYSVCLNITSDHYIYVPIKNRPKVSADPQGATYFIKRGQNGQILPGVEFIIRYPSLKSRTVKSGPDGKVEFKDLDPLSATQRYRITEVPPVGYESGQRLVCNLKVYIEDGAVKTEFEGDSGLKPETIDGKPTLVFDNTPIARSAAFTKRDQNGDPLLGTTVTFSVERRGDEGQFLAEANTGVAADAVKVCLDVDGRVAAEDKDKYFSYLPKPTVESDGNGIVKLEDLLYGDYKLTENSPKSPLLPLDPSAQSSHATLHLRVNADGIYASEFPITDGTKLGTKEVPKLTDEGGTFSVENRVQYGILQINKAVGEKDVNDNLITTKPLTDPGKSFIPIQGITFDIFKADIAGNKVGITPFMTLTTNIEGKFAVGTDGYYTTTDNKRKQLVVGNYILKEGANPDYIVLSERSFPFTIAAQETPSTPFVPEVQYMNEKGGTKDEEKTLFLNEPTRGRLELKKVDGDYTQVGLSGAKFKVYTKSENGTKGDYIADLKSPTGASVYVLDEAKNYDASSSELPVLRNSEGKLYIQKNGKNFELLYGDYLIEECVLPKVANTNIDYAKPTGLYRVTLKNALVKTVTNPDGKTTDDMRNYVTKQNISINKQVESWIQDPSNPNQAKFEKYMAGNGFEFRLSADGITYPGPANMPSDTKFATMTAATTGNGDATFYNIPMGTYLLTETKIPEVYGTLSATDSDAYITPMKPVKVVIDDKGVTFSYADAPHDIVASANTNNGQVPDTVSDTVSNNGKLDNDGKALAKLTVRNNYKLGSATGTKAECFPAVLKAVTARKLKGAEFELVEKKTKLKLKAISGENGAVSFTSVPYGLYTLTETKPPVGYKAIVPFDVSVKTADTVLTSDGKLGDMKDMFMLASIQFLKVDQNGIPIGSGKEKIIFDIKRTSGSQPDTLPEGYQLPITAETDSEGVVKVTLPYGTYTLKEQSRSNSIIHAAAEEFTITIERPSTTDLAQTKVTIKSTEPNQEKSLTGNDGTTGIVNFDFTTGAGAFKLENTVKKGDIRISKQRMELKGNGTTAEAAGTPLKGSTFELYRQVKENEPEKSPYATLKTNSQGGFDSTDGKYGGKELLAGNTYYLKEVIDAASTFRQLPPSAEFIKFTAVASDTGKVIEFTYDGSSTLANSVDKDTPPSAFGNIPKRGTITVLKKDVDDSSLLRGAEFGVYTDEECTEDNKVAFLTEGSSDGTYVLSNVDRENGNEVNKMKGVVPYLYKATDASSWKILTGTYWLKETVVPVGYKTPPTVHKVTVADEISGNSALNPSMTITNTLVQTAIKFLKVDQNGELIKNTSTEAGKEITFTLTRTPSGADGAKTPLDTRAEDIITDSDYPTITNDANGVISVTGLIAGNYVLTETKPDWVSRTPPEVAITVTQNPDKSLTVTLGDPSQSDNSGDKKALTATPAPSGEMLCDFTQGTSVYRLQNQLTYGLVDILKVEADIHVDNTLKPLAKPIPGVVFQVYEDVNADGSYQKKDLKKLTLVTGEDGKFKRDTLEQYLDETGVAQTYRLVYGKSYLLKEVKLPGKDYIDEKYVLDENYYPFKIDASKYFFVGTTKKDAVSVPTDMGVISADSADTNSVFPNTPLRRGNVSLQKTDREFEDTAVAGAEFEVYTNSAEKVKVARLLNNQTGTYELQPLEGSQPENSSGQAYIKKEASGKYYLLSGKYFVKETKAPSGYMLPEDKAENYWYFAISGNNETVKNADLTTSGGQSKAFTNTLWKRDIVVNKRVENLLPNEFHAAGTQTTDDIFTFKLEAVGGVSGNGKPFTPMVRRVELAGINQGKVVFTDVSAGKYTLTETMTETVKQGGTLADVYAAPKAISVTVDEKGVSYNAGAPAPEITVNNVLKRGTITGKKVARDENDNLVNLKDAEFVLTPIAPQRAGTLKATSKDNGEFVFQNVPLGEYELRETKTPGSDYELSDKLVRVKVTSEGQNVTVDVNPELQFINKAFGTLRIEKRAEELAANDISGEMRPGQGFTFKITGTSPTDGVIQEFLNVENVTGADSVVRQADGLYVTTGTTGVINIKNLPVGSYKVQEQLNEKTGEGGLYLPDIKVHAADITIAPATGKVSAPEIKVDNYLGRGQISGLKTTADKTTPLAGAVIGLFPAGTTSFTEANLWRGQKVTTGADGIYLFQKIPYGTYLVAELTAPSGYNLNTTTRYEVTVAAEAVKTTGFLLEGTAPKAGAETPILIANTKRSSGGGGGGGGGTKPVEPMAPGPGTPTTSPKESTPVNPGGINPENPGATTPENPLPTVPVETVPGGGNEIIIPPETPPGSDLEIKDSNSDTVFTGKVDENGRVHVDLPPGDYIIVTLDENGVPLGSMTFTIEDPFTPLGALAAPNAGDNSISIAALAVLMIISLAGIILVARKKKEEEQKTDGK